MKASDNEFAKVILKPLGLASAPVDAAWKLYPMADGVYARSSNSIVGPLGATGSSSGYPLTWTRATSMPGSPATGQRVTRTDLGNIDFEWDGTRWLSTTLFREPIVSPQSPMTSWTADASIGRLASWAPTYTMWLVTMDMSTDVLVTNTGANYWTVTLTKYNTAIGGATTVVSRTTAADTVAVVTPSRTAIGAVWDGATYPLLQCEIAKTGTPGAIIAFGVSLSYRIVGV